MSDTRQVIVDCLTVLEELAKARNNPDILNKTELAKMAKVSRSLLYKSYADIVLSLDRKRRALVALSVEERSAKKLASAQSLLKTRDSEVTVLCRMVAETLYSLKASKTQVAALEKSLERERQKHKDEISELRRRLAKVDPLR